MNIYERHETLNKNVHGYWEKRILAEIGYLLELLSEEDLDGGSLPEQVMATLMEDYEANGQIQVQTAKEAEQRLMSFSKRAKELELVCAAHAHIDMNWQWGYQETVAAVLDTVRTMLVLLEEYPEFHFSQSQASVYYILEEYAPELLEQVKRRVQEGRWEVTASTWVELDKNMPDGESMARQLLYTKKYLSKLLDIKEESMNLDYEPDTFGHSWNVPEILSKGGVSRYYHCRGNEDEQGIYRWRGASGAEVLVYCDPRWYNIRIANKFYHGIYQGLSGFCKKYGLSKALLVYGVGDHGGGPTRRDIDRLIDMSSWPIFPTIRFGTYGEYYDYLEERKEQFPVVEKELNYVFAGCYTSQARIKMANRIGENRLKEAEILESMASLKVPGYHSDKKLEEAWRTILFNQFHDILPGSGVLETREYAMGKFQEAMARAGAQAVRSMDAICDAVGKESLEKIMEDDSMGGGAGVGADQERAYGFTLTERGNGTLRYYALFNVAQVTRTEPTEIVLWNWEVEPKNTRITDMSGKEYPFQVLEEKKNCPWGHTYCKMLVWIPIPATGYTICRVEKKDMQSISGLKNHFVREDHITDEPIILENDKVKAIFDVSTMKCISFRRKSDGKELLTPSKPACGLKLIKEEVSQGMTSWRVGKTANIMDLNEVCMVLPGKICTSGLRKELEYDMAMENLKIHVNICLDEGSELLDFRFKVDWNLLGNRTEGVPQLRFMVPCGYEVENYRYAIPFGMIERPPLAQDVPAVGLGCAMPKEQGSALLMMSDCKYGFRGDEEGLSLNLIRGSYDPDPIPEVGTHLIRVAVGACDVEEENLALMEERYLHPVIVRSCGVRPSETDAYRSLFSLKGAVLSAIKGAEDGNGLIVRVYNPSGEEKAMSLSLPGRKIKAALCDFLENNLESVSIEDGEKIKFTMGRYEVASFRVLV